MKENKYDEEAFFEKYSQMPRSQMGLRGAAEWPTLKGMLPEFAGRRVIDLGCGYGWHCRYAAEHGAASVLGVDLSQKMLARAAEQNAHPAVVYCRAALEDLSFPPGSFDVAVSSLALHYVRDLAPLVGSVFSWLTPGGDFVFSMEHPVFTAQGKQDWLYDSQGGILCFPVDRYFEEGARQAVFLGEPVTKYHHTLTTVFGALLEAGFVIRKVAEPQPPEDMMEQPGMKDELRRPMMLIAAAKKP